MSQLPSNLRDRLFTLSEALKNGVSRYQLSKYIADGTVENVARGVYCAPKDDFTEEDQFEVATLRVGRRSAICLISALSHYGLTDIIPKKTWIMVPASKRTNYSNLKLLRTRKPSWRIGVERNTRYSITSLERTLVDTICARSKIGPQIGAEALRKAILSKRTTLGKVLDMAKALGVSHRLIPYVEALS